MRVFSAISRLGGAQNDEGHDVSDAQMALILRQGAEGIPVADICRKAWISYDGLLPDEIRRLKQLEDENNKLRKLVADLSLVREMHQDVIRRKR